jgi:phosphonate metabolism protein PhnN/1,5-bisphosphokinase (PRPP-forming)
MKRGTLFLVVGPSGAGKDSLLRGARAALAENESFLFARRVITRPAAGEREDYESLSADEFLKRAQRGGFMLSWRVYDTDYGIPAAYNNELGTGRHVVANVSREVVAAAVSYFAPARVIQVTAPREVLQQRLAARADPATAAARLARAVVLPHGVPVTHLLNIGDLDIGTRRLVRLLTAA